MWEMGIINNWLHAYYIDLEECAVMAKAADPTRALDLEECQSVFWVLLIGLSGSGCLFVIERRLRCICCFACCRLEVDRSVVQA